MNKSCLLFFISFLFLISSCTSVSSKKNLIYKEQAIQKIVLSNIQTEGAGNEILLYALGLLDVNYHYGGNNPSYGLDCSGMVVYIYKNALGVDLPRTAAKMAEASEEVSFNKMRIGDLVFFNTLKKPYSHVGLYIGNNKFIHAPHSNAKIRVDLLSSPYYKKHFESAHTFFAR